MGAAPGLGGSLVVTPEGQCGVADKVPRTHACMGMCVGGMLPAVPLMLPLLLVPQTQPLTHPCAAAGRPQAWALCGHSCRMHGTLQAGLLANGTGPGQQLQCLLLR